jgi:hypothetical protein
VVWDLVVPRLPEATISHAPDLDRLRQP